MAEYRGRLPLFHVDLYRLADAAEALAGGLIDERQAEGVTIVEWAERLADAMPAERLEVLIDGAGDDPRRITHSAGRRGLRPIPRRGARDCRDGGSARATRRLGDGAQAGHGRPMTRGRILAIDTSGTNALVALAEADGELVAERRWLGRLSPRRGAAGPDRRDAHGHRRLDGRTRRDRRRHRTRAHSPGCASAWRRQRRWPAGSDVPIAGVATSEALLEAAGLAGAFEARQAVLLLPAGPSDRVMVAGGKARLRARRRRSPRPRPDASGVAVDLPGRAPARGARARAQAEAGLAAALVRLGADRLAAGGDDVARLVPEYVTLPRGVPVARGEVRWSHDHR